MDTYSIDPAALRGVALDLTDAARAVDRRADVTLPPRLPYAADSEEGIGRLVTSATGVATAAATAADDLHRLLAETETLDDEVAAAFLELRPGWS